jgi:hypothetical protein
VTTSTCCGCAVSVLNDRGLDSVNGWFTRATDHGYRYLRPFEQA